MPLREGLNKAAEFKPGHGELELAAGASFGVEGWAATGKLTASAHILPQLSATAFAEVVGRSTQPIEVIAGLGARLTW